MAVRGTPAKNLNVAFFDFVTEYGGKPRLTIDLMVRLCDEFNFTVMDPYGASAEYRQALAASGISNTVLQPSARIQTIGNDGRVLLRMTRLFRAVPELLALQGELRRRIENHRPRLVWTSSLKGARFVLGAAGRTQLPLALHFRRTWRSQMARGWRRRVLIDDRVTLLTESGRVADQLKGCGLSADRIFVVPNSVDIGDVRRRAVSSLETPLPQAERPIRILLAGTLNERKGHTTAIRALARLLQAGHDAVLYIPGNCSKGRSQYVRTLKELAVAANVHVRVVFIGWRRDLLQVMKASTVSILPSVDEGLPLALMESMALERPVVGTPVGGVEDLIVHERTGWIHAVGDDAGLARFIIQAHEARRRARMVHNATKHLQDVFSPQTQKSAAIRAFRAAVEKCES